MGDDTAARFRKRAQECRDLAADARSDDWRESLLALAEDLDEEADRIEAEEAD